MFLKHTEKQWEHQKKPKSDKQIVKWLKNPHSDSAEYRLWGNGVCLNIVEFVLAGIVWANEKFPADFVQKTE